MEYFSHSQTEYDLPLIKAIDFYLGETTRFLYSDRYQKRTKILKLTGKVSAYREDLVRNDLIITVFNMLKTFFQHNTGLLHHYTEIPVFPLSRFGNLKRSHFFIWYRYLDFFYHTAGLEQYRNLSLKVDTKNKYLYVQPGITIFSRIKSLVFLSCFMQSCNLNLGVLYIKKRRNKAFRFFFLGFNHKIPFTIVTTKALLSLKKKSLISSKRKSILSLKKKRFRSRYKFFKKSFKIIFYSSSRIRSLRSFRKRPKKSRRKLLKRSRRKLFSKSRCKVPSRSRIYRSRYNEKKYTKVPTHHLKAISTRLSSIKWKCRIRRKKKRYLRMYKRPRAVRLKRIKRFIRRRYRTIRWLRSRVFLKGTSKTHKRRKLKKIYRHYLLRLFRVFKRLKR